jgi:hypothetical protein
MSNRSKPTRVAEALEVTAIHPAHLENTLPFSQPLAFQLKMLGGDTDTFLP